MNDESEVLKRQIQYLTDLINSSGGPSTRTETNRFQRPNTYSHLSTKHKLGKQKYQHHGAIIERPKVKRESTAKFSWKRPSTHVKTESARVIPTKNFDVVKEKQLLGLSTTVGASVSNIQSQSNTLNRSNASAQNEIRHSKLNSIDKQSKETDGKNKLIFTRTTVDDKPTKVKPETEKSISVPVSRSENLKCVSPIITENTALAKSISTKLRNHPFMKRSKNIHEPNKNGVSCSFIGSKEDSFCSVQKTIKHSSLPTEKEYSQNSSFATENKKHENEGKQNILKTTESISVKNDKKHNSPTDTVSTKEQKRNFSNQTESSPSKKEVMEELNRKLSEASNKILQLKKQLTFKSVQDPAKAVVQQMQQKSKSIGVQSKKVDGKQNFHSSNNLQSGVSVSSESPGYSKSLPKTELSVKNFRNNELNQESVVKSRFVFKKSDPKEQDSKNSMSSISVQCSQTHNKVSVSKSISVPTKSSTSIKSTITFNSKYKFSKDMNDVPFKAVSSNSENVPKTSGSLGVKTIKSKYHLRKIDLASSQQHSMLTHHKKDLPVFNSKYKLKKNPHGMSLPTSLKASRDTAAVKVIKSKYKLRKVFHGTNSLMKKRKTPMKTVLSSKYKLRKVPMHKSSSYPISSFDVQKSNRFFRNSFSHPKPYQSGYRGKYHHGGYYGSRYKNFYNMNNQWQNQKAWRSHRNYYSTGYIPSSYIDRSNKAPMFINKKYLFKRLQSTRGATEAYSNDMKGRKTKEQKKVNSLVVINGMLYKSSGHSLVKTNQKSENTDKIVVKKMNTTCMKIVKVRGVKFQMDSTGKTLKRLDSSPSKTGLSHTHVKSGVQRVDIGGMTFVQTKPGTLEQIGSNQTKVMASRVKHRSIITAAAKFKKDNTKKKVNKKYCMFFNRFGKCQRGEKCPYVHDPDKVAVCTRFLRGTCKVDDCPFSHKVSKDKMPTCSYFLRGVCNRDDCPYRHVNVSKTAKICQGFVNGFCSQGDKCPKKHTLECPSFSKTGVCTEHKPCKLKHIKKRQKTITKETSEMSINMQNDDKSELKRKLEEHEEDSDIPFKQRKLPAYISISSSSEETSDTSTNQNMVSGIKIRPQLERK